MKDELIELSKEKGFLSRDRLVSVYDSYYYLWMCELQQWLREKHDIEINIPCDYFPFNKKHYRYIIWDGRKNTSPASTIQYEEYNNAFEEGLITALNMI